MKLYIQAQALQQKMMGKEEEKLNKSYSEILENLRLSESEMTSTRCFEISDFVDRDLCEKLKGMKFCVKYGKTINRFITLYLKDKFKLHDRLTLFFDSEGNHKYSEYIHTMGRKHRFEKMEEVTNYEHNIETLFTRALGENVELMIVRD